MASKVEPQVSNADMISHSVNYGTESTLIEYQWPTTKEGDFFFLQENVISFLGINACILANAGIKGRQVTNEEKAFLQKRELIVEGKCSKDLVAIKTDSLLELMMDRFPQKYKEYLQFAHERDRRKIIENHCSQMVVKNMGKTASHIKKAIKDASEYNSHLNQDRKEERSAYFDMQTQIIQVPRKVQRIIASEKRKRNRYPVALMPGQFQEYFKIYSKDELNSLPLSTITSQWPTDMSKRVQMNKEEFQNDSDNTSNTQSSSDDDSKSSGNDDSDGEGPSIKRVLRERNGAPRHRNKVGIKNDSFCGICLKGEESNKKGTAESFVHCSFCENSGHPSCLEMNRQLVEVIKTYPWQCMECKTCTLCSNPHDEEHMMFCDNCDRGYHSYCVGLKSIPDGRWICEKCGKCASCLTRFPGADGTPGKWREEFKRSKNGGEAEFLQLHCHKCSKLFRSGNFCPVCLKVYRSDEKDLPMVCCDSCDRWIHTDCDGIDDKRYQ